MVVLINLIKNTELNKKNEKYAYFRYFASFWVHAMQKQMFEINDRYFEFQENELDLYLKLRKQR